MKSKFHTKKGFLTPYAMACGYIHCQANSNIKLSLLSGGGFELYVSKDIANLFGPLCLVELESGPGFDGKIENANSLFFQYTSLTQARCSMLRVLNLFGMQVTRKSIITDKGESLSIVY